MVKEFIVIPGNKVKPRDGGKQVYDIHPDSLSLGNYSNNCKHCKKQFYGDKQQWICLKCNPKLGLLKYPVGTIIEAKRVRIDKNRAVIWE